MKLAVDQIVTRDNVRSDLGDLGSLTGSVDMFGLFQPVTVYQDGADGYVLLLGHRRLAAVQAAGRTEIEANVVDAPGDDAERILVQLDENLEQVGLSPLDEARAYQRLVGLGMAQNEIAAQRGVSPATISQRLKLLDLVPEAREAVESGRLSAGAGEQLARLDSAQQREIVPVALAKPTVRRVQRAVERKIRRDRVLQAESQDLAVAGLEPQPEPLAGGVSTGSACKDLKMRLARQCGLDAGQLMESRLAQYDLLLSQGIGVSLSIGGGTMFQVSLPRQILGLQLGEGEREFHDDYVNLGEFFLAAKEDVRELTNTGSAARSYLRRSVLQRFGFEFEPGWVWVPVLAEGKGAGFAEVKARLEEYRESYLAVVEDLAYGAEDLKAETIASIEAIAGTVYSRTNGEGDPPPEFVENLTTWVESNFPTPAQIRARGYFHINYRVYPMPSQIAADQAAAESERERQRLLVEHQAELLEQERRAKEAQLDPMIHGIAKRLESLVGEAVGSVTNALNRGGNLPGPTVLRLRNLVQELGPLNLLVGNADLEKLTARLDGIVKPGNQIDTGGLSAALSSLQQAAQKQSRALAPVMAHYLEL